MCLCCCMHWAWRKYQKIKVQTTLLGLHLTLFCACAAIWFLSRRNSFQSRHLRGKSFSILLVRLVEVKITISSNYLVICDGLKSHILYFYWISSRKSMSSRGGIRSGSGRKLLSPRSRLVSKEKKKKRRKDGRTSIGNFMLLPMYTPVGNSWLCKFSIIGGWRPNKEVSERIWKLQTACG